MRLLCLLLPHRWRVTRWQVYPRAPHQITAPVWWVARECRRCGATEERT